jgi:hypothetical protein
MHFRDGYPQDFITAVNAIKRAGLAPTLLEDYVDVTGVDGRITRGAERASRHGRCC